MPDTTDWSAVKRNFKRLVLRLSELVSSEVTRFETQDGEPGFFWWGPNSHCSLQVHLRDRRVVRRGVAIVRVWYKVSVTRETTTSLCWLV